MNSYKPYTCPKFAADIVKIGAFVSFLSFTTVNSVSATEPNSGPLACDFSGVDSPLVSAQISNLDIEGAELRLPRDYVMSAPFQDGEQRRGLLMRAYIDSFSAYPDRDLYLADGTYKGKDGFRDWVQILLSSKLPMDVIALRAVTSEYETGLKWGDPATDTEGKPGPHDLFIPTYPSLGRSDAYFGKTNQTITDVINCTAEGRVPFPSCGHIFEAGPYDVKVSYARSELHRWRGLRDKTAKLLKCFTIKQPIELPD